MTFVCNISEASLNGTCFWPATPFHFATAGQRVDPTRESTFVWREIAAEMQSEKVTMMDYTNWAPNKPDNSHLYPQPESCMSIYSDSYLWNDMACHIKMCSICEIDM